MKLYVPNPQKWVDLFEQLSDGKASSKQSGAGRRLYVIPMGQSKSSNDKPFTIKAVSPAEATTAQAKSELEREDIKPGGLVDVRQSRVGHSRTGTKRKGQGLSKDRESKYRCTGVKKTPAKAKKVKKQSGDKTDIYGNR